MRSSARRNATSWSANIMQVLEHVWLGNGERAKKLLEVRGEPLGGTIEVRIDTASMAFEDVRLEREHEKRRK